MRIRRAIGRTLPLLLASLALSAGASAAQARSPIEGVWSFNGGRVAIQPLGAGTFVGTVVAQTAFAQCPHPVGEQMWTGLRTQPDGSFWGLHQWYFEGTCAANPQLGLTAWRVIGATGGSRFLRVCFSSPGSAQPTIAADGSSAHVTYGCVDSALIAPLPASTGALAFTRSVTLPSAKRCLSRREFKIHLRDPADDPLERVTIIFGGHRLAIERQHNRIAAAVNLRGLPKGSFTVKIRAITVLGHVLSGKRTYHTCVSRARSHSKSGPRARANAPKRH
jgi:hypothetical protein